LLRRAYPSRTNGRGAASRRLRSLRSKALLSSPRRRGAASHFGRLAIPWRPWFREQPGRDD